MRLPIRSLLLLSVAALSGCADFGPSAAAGRQRASLAVAPRFEDGAARTSAVLAQVGIGFDNVRIIIVHPAADTVADTTIVYSPSDTARALTLKVLAVPNDLLTVTMQFRAAASVLFEGTANATAVPLTSTVTPEKAIDVVVKYVGPGATAAKLSITPGSGNYLSGITTQFTAVAADAQGVPIPNAPIAWSVSNDAVATISTTGLLTPKVVRGSVTVKATIGTVAQSVSVNLQPAAAGIRVVQGAAQTAPPGSTLPLPVIIELDGTDGQPITGSGLSATFVANTAGSIAPASVPLDANG
ncbi:MAG TPA: Ig-like domain-containing protein, partial [Gemmatimonadaceae bacterium]